ncbi:hypothetical protein [Singulisphaera acidiphila]|uniref:Uncharacterized protein n=1 Tax=Singulisphaera acidiphila (strain ATCC BAA-1392 / DSM 18658 / VKM B-2454 / MOB10) TaxID=886293 RepID=L0D9B9_SINAD|nr:hypothetical protein [Singulisphaera acidiphila]AGA25455.1 hypothetical protein Sinac_1056 [Singulisphaera acidiphila DSM 18658]
MRHVRALGATIAAPLLSMLLCGCGEGRPAVESSTEEATVKGKVVIKGEPVHDGSIIFDPTNVERKMAPLRSAPIKDGVYTATTLIGDNTVRVDGKQAQKAGVNAGVRPFKVSRGENSFDLNFE